MTQTPTTDTENTFRDFITVVRARQRLGIPNANSSGLPPGELWGIGSAAVHSMIPLAW